MALVGKWTKIEYIQSETETEIVAINYPNKLPKGHPDFDKAGTTEEIEVPKSDIIETIFEDVYVIVHSINSWKQIINGVTETLFNITYRIYNNESERHSDYNSYILQEYLVSEKLDYTLGKTDIEQAYKLVNNIQGLEELIND